MKKTASQLVDDLYQILLSSPLPAAITGTLYPEGMRPEGALTEDLVVALVEGSAEQVQSGRALVQLFVADIDAPDTSDTPTAPVARCRNRARCAELESIASEWAESIEQTQGLQLVLDQMVRTRPHEDHQQHVVEVQFQFYYTPF